MTTSRFIPVKAFHPGLTLAEKLNEMEMSVKEFAKLSSLQENNINKILKGESSITPEIAVVFDNLTGIPAHFWLNKQKHYDDYMARTRRETVRAAHSIRVLQNGNVS